MGMPESVSDDIFAMSEQNCFRGAMLFGQKASATLSLFIWNAAAIDLREADATPCLFSAFIAKAGMDWSIEDRFGRLFLNAC